MTAIMTEMSPDFGQDGQEPTRSADARLLRDAALVLLWLFLSYSASKMLFGSSHDFYEYLIYYDSIPRTFSILDTRFEPGFHVVSWFSRNILNIDLTTLIFFIASISLAIKFTLFRRNLEYPLLAALLYTVIFYPIHEYTQYRVGISLALAYWAVHLLMDRRFFWASLLFSIAFLFHYSSILVPIATAGALVVRGRRALIALIIVSIIGVTFLGQIRYLFQDVFTSLNPLSGAYLVNTAMIESASILSVNNLLLIGAIICYIGSGLYVRSRYQNLFMTMTIGCILPIILLPDAPVIAQRSKEVLFVAVIFLSCRSKLSLFDLPGFALVVAVAGLLGYLWVDSGVVSF
jgi:hypothetical protein